jgi:L-lactate dehydrogenase complex protein LldG
MGDARYQTVGSRAADGAPAPVRPVGAEGLAAGGVDRIARPAPTAAGDVPRLVAARRGTPVTARAEILRRIGVALRDQPTPAPVDRDYRTAGSVAADRGQLLDQFVERLADYKATVHRSSPDGVGAELTVILAGRGITRVAVPDGFREAWLPNVAVVREPLSTVDLDSIGAVLTSCAVAVAETGTIILDASAGQGRRALTLVPDYHLVVVRAEQVLAIVPDAIAALDATKPLTWISGPSATSDIELNRVEGVHGPRTLDVLLVS